MGLRATAPGGAGIPTWLAGIAIVGAVTIGAELVWIDGGGGAPRRFAVVEPGRIYRGGYPDKGELEWLHRQLGVGEIVSLMDESRDAEKAGREHAAAEALGLRLEEFPMPGDGRGDFDTLDAAADAIGAGASKGTIYVHCSAGKQRSNAATAAWRMKHCGWTDDQAIEELTRRFGFEPDDEARLAAHLRAYYSERIVPARRATVPSGAAGAKGGG